MVISTDLRCGSSTPVLDCGAGVRHSATFRDAAARHDLREGRFEGGNARHTPRPRYSEGWSAIVERDGPQALVEGLEGRNLVLVGLPGAGKSSVGKRLANRLAIPFIDADCEIEKAAGMPIADIFARHGEAAFRAGEARVIARLLADGPKVIATGGGAFMAETTRRAIAERGIAIWLDATSDVLVARVARRDHRPLFRGVDARDKIEELRARRDPVFAQADVRVMSSAGPHDKVVRAVIDAVSARVLGRRDDGTNLDAAPAAVRR